MEQAQTVKVQQQALVNEAMTPVPGAALPSTDSGSFTTPADRGERQRHEDHRTVLFLMLFRVVLASVLLLCAIMLVEFSIESERLSTKFSRFLFLLLSGTYAASLSYALLLPRIRHLV